MAFDVHKNLAVSTVATAPSPATSGISLGLPSGHGARFPAVPFNATVCPVATQPDPTNAEIVRVTANAADTLTIVRAQEGTTARAIVVTDQIFASITAKSLTDIETSLGLASPLAVDGGVASMSPYDAASSNALLNTLLLLTYFTSPVTFTTTRVRTMSRQASTPTPTLCQIGLYSVAGNGDLTRIAVTANDTALWNADNTRFTKSWTASASIVAGSRYAVGLVAASSVALPGVVGYSCAPLNSPEQEFFNMNPKLSAYASAGSGPPATIAVGALSSISFLPYAVILP